MRLLLTSAGIKNPSIHKALVEVLGKPISDCNAILIPTAGTGIPTPPLTGHGGSSVDRNPTPHERARMETPGRAGAHRASEHRQERWDQWVREADVVLVNGGDAMYLCHWMRESGLADLLPSLGEAAWVGLSAGSMVMTPRIGEDFVGWKPPNGNDRTLGIVDFSICPQWTRASRATRWPSGEMGGRHLGSGVRGRRRDRHQGRRWRRRSRLRGPLDTVHPRGQRAPAARATGSRC